VPWGLEPDVSVAPGGVVPGDGPVVVQVRDAHRRPDVGALLERVAAAGRPAVVVEWGWPGPSDGRLPRICARGYSRPGAAAVSELLRKAGWDR
jgi:beta-N-acetylhexosaminidase